MDDDVLKKQYQFDDFDLYDNRNGFIRPKQRARLGRQRSVINTWARIIGLILMIGDLAAIYLTWRIHFIEWDILSILGNWAILIPLFMGLVALWVGFSKDERIRLSKVEGPLDVVKVKSKYIDGSTDTCYELRCGSEKFEASPAMADMGSKGEIYAIYYFKDEANGNTLFSAEPVDSVPPV